MTIDPDGTLNLGDCDLLPDGKHPFYTIGVHGPPPRPSRKKDCPPHIWLIGRDRCMTCDTHRPPPPTMVVVPV